MKFRQTLLDPPWMGLSEEDWNEKCSTYDEDYEDYLEDRADREFDRMRDEGEL